MIVCMCHGINDREVRRHIHKGCKTVPAMIRSCKAGGDCGSCCSSIRQMIREHGSRKV